MKKLFPISFLFAALIFTGCRSEREWSEIFVRKGEEYSRKGKTEQALEEYRKALQIDPFNPKAYGRMALLYKKMGNCSAVLEFLNTAEFIQKLQITDEDRRLRDECRPD